MTDTFDVTWVPLVGMNGTGTLREREAKFGDGYRQHAPDGLNTHTQSWPLSWMGNATKIGAIRDFLVAHTGQSFFWTPPLGAQGYYACAQYNLVPLGNGVYQLNATFAQDFKP